MAVVLGTVVLGASTWLRWPLVNPFACDQAQQKITEATDVVDQLPRELVATTRPVNDCDSSNDGWVEVTVPDGMDVTAVTAALEGAGWSRTDLPRGSGDDTRIDGDQELARSIDGRRVEAVVYEPMVEGGLPLITVEAS